MSEWNYTKCAKPFASQEEAKAFMLEREFAGQILLRENGGYTAVCPTYPEGYYPDAVSVETINESDFESNSNAVVLDDNCCS